MAMDVATSEITIRIPTELAESLTQRIPADEVPVFVAASLRRALRLRRTAAEQEADWDAACEAANNDPETREIELEMAALPDTMTEEWNEELFQVQMRERDAMLERACDLLEGDADLKLLDRQMDVLNDDPIGGSSHVSKAW